MGAVRAMWMVFGSALAAQALNPPVARTALMNAIMLLRMYSSR